MLQIKAKGKITINIEKTGEALSSSMQTTGIAKNSELMLTTLLVHFASGCFEAGKDPEQVIDRHLKDILKMSKQENSDKKEGGN